MEKMPAQRSRRPAASTAMQEASEWPTRPTGHVFSFEPADEALTAARRTMAANRLANVTLLPHAVGNVSGQSHLRMSPNESMNMLVDTGDPHADLRTVPVCRIDDWMGRHQAPTHVDLMKLDVEGHELAVLHGAENTLLRWNPTLIVELHRRGDVPYQPHEPVDWLRARGYHLDILQPPVPNPASLDDALRSLANPELDPNKTYILHLIARR